MKKSLRIIVVLAIISALLVPYTISYGADEEAFFEVASEEITVSDVIEATIYIDEVSYDNFIFELVTDFDISEIEITQDDEDESIDTEIIVEDSNDVIIQISKSGTSLESIVLNCCLPDDISVGDTVTLIATVTNSDNEEESETIEITITIVETTEINISAESANSEYDESNLSEVGTSESGLSNTDSSSILSSGDFSSSSELSSMSSSDSTNQSSDSLDSSSMSTTMESGETATYNGSDNCYLSELSVDSYELNKTFSKECTTYFITVDDDTDSIDITATAEDDEATICIYGDDNISTGENKVLITVTAENGNTRTYRIYVTKN